MSAPELSSNPPPARPSDRRPPPPPAPARGGVAPVGADVADPAWYAIPAADVVTRLESDARMGLTAAGAAERLYRLGPNTLAAEEDEPWWKEAVEALTEPLVLLLLAVGVLYAVFGRPEDAITIFVVIVAVSAIEVANEARAKRALKSLVSLSAPEATVVRDGTPHRTASGDLVPGDLAVLEAGHRVPADLRLVTASALRVDESSLTGESVPSTKQANAVVPPDADLGDRITMAYAGTLVTAGQGRGVVVATGARTEVGRLGALARAAREPRTPLQLQLRQLAGWLLWVAVGFSVLVPVLSVLIAGRPWREALLEGLTLAFATIPEELPILITMVLGLGAYRLAREHAITRRLQAAETLGSVSVIGTDKTGTLTENRMRVADVVVDGPRRRPLAPAPGDAAAAPVPPAGTLARLLTVGALATGAQVSRGEDARGDAAHRGTAGGGHDPRFIGDPTDTALLAAADTAGLLGVRDQVRVVEEFPFDDVRKRVSAVYDRDGVRWLAVKGAPEEVLVLCERVRADGHDVPLDGEHQRALRQVLGEMAASGQRVIAFAERQLSAGAPPTTADERDLTLLGLAGLEDPARPEVPAAIRALQGAGVRVLMLTGDHPATAAAIARQVGIDAGRVVTGRELAEVDDTALRQLVADASVFARIAPEHKLRIVDALAATGAVIAVTGDGVNDAPALRQAAIGVAMGRGSDVAREAADLVLTDDNFATVASAVRAGRVLYDNLWKAVRYYLAAKVGLIVASLGAVLAGLPLPFAPVQIILLELFMDLGASTTFVAEPPEGDVMARPPRAPGRPFLDREIVVGILGGGAALAAAVLVAYGWATHAGLGAAAAHTTAFATWLIGHVVLAGYMRAARVPLMTRGLRRSRPFGIWVIAAVGLAVAGPFVPFLRGRLGLALLPWMAWPVIVGAALLLPSCWEVASWGRWLRTRDARHASDRVGVRA